MCHETSILILPSSHVLTPLIPHSAHNLNIFTLHMFNFITLNHLDKITGVVSF